MAIQGGQSTEGTTARLDDMSSKVRENGEQYAFHNAQNAAKAVERQRSRA
jgi:hypothetical protein